MGPDRRLARQPAAPVSTPRWIVHLPTTLTSMDEAISLTVALRGSLRHVTAIDFGEATLSEEDRQFVRTRVWCDARVGDSARCLLRADHDGPCTRSDGRSR